MLTNLNANAAQLVRLYSLYTTCRAIIGNLPRRSDDPLISGIRNARVQDAWRFRCEFNRLRDAGSTL